MAHRPPDGGYGWIVTFAAFCGYCLHGSLLFTMTLMYQALLERFEMDAADTGSLGAIFGTSILIATPIINQLCKYLGLRTMVVLSGMLYSLGLLLCAFSVHPAMVTVGYGVMAGFAGGIYNFCIFIIISDYFDKKRSFVLGLCMCGLGVGGLVTPPILELLFKAYGFTGALMLQAGMLLNMIPVGMLFLPVIKTCPQTENGTPELQTKRERSVSTGNVTVQENFIHSVQSLMVTTNEKSDANTSSGKQTFWKRSGLYNLKSPLFVTYCFLMCSFMIHFFCTSIYMSGLAKEKCKLSISEIALILSAASVFDIVAKLVAGLVLNTKCVNNTRPYVFVGLKLSHCLISFIIASFVYDFVTMTIAWSVFFANGQVFFSQMTVILHDITGPEDFPSALGLSRFAQGLCVIPGIRIAGFLIDWLHSYTFVFYFCATLEVLTATMFLIANCCKRK